MCPRRRLSGPGKIGEPDAQRDGREDQIDDAEREDQAEALGGRHAGLVSWVWTVPGTGRSVIRWYHRVPVAGIGEETRQVTRQARSAMSSGS